MARARRRKSNQSNSLTYFIVGIAVLILIIFAFPSTGKFTSTLTDSSSSVELQLDTPDFGEIVQVGNSGVINLTFRNVQDFDTLSFETYLPNAGILDIVPQSPGPITYSNTNAVVSGKHFGSYGTNKTTLNFHGTNGTNISEQMLSITFRAYGLTNLSEIVISNILFGDSNGNAIASFTNISRYDVVPANLPPTVRIHSPSSGSSWPHDQAVIFNISINDPDGTITNDSYSYYLNRERYYPPLHQDTRYSSFYFIDNISIGNHAFYAEATDDTDTSIHQVSFTVYNATVPTQTNQTNQTNTTVPATPIHFILPVAVISSPQAGQTYYVGEDIFSDGSESYDADGSIVAYSWYAFGQFYSDANFTHTGPNTAGNYTIALNVTNNNGATSLTSLTIIQVSSLGDINGDGRITGADVTAAEWLSVGVNRNYVSTNADTNQDSSTNSLDITGVERILLA